MHVALTLLIAIHDLRVFRPAVAARMLVSSCGKSVSHQSQSCPLGGPAALASAEVNAAVKPHKTVTAEPPSRCKTRNEAKYSQDVRIFVCDCRRGAGKGHRGKSKSSCQLPRHQASTLMSLHARPTHNNM